MAENASNFSIAGLTQAGLNQALDAIGSDYRVDIKDTFLGSLIGGNSISGLFAGDLPAYEAGERAFNEGLGSKPLSVGRRVGDVLALNIAGKGGRPLALGAANRGAMKIALRAQNLIGLGIPFWGKMAIDAFLTALEAAYCHSKTQ